MSFQYTFLPFLVFSAFSVVAARTMYAHMIGSGLTSAISSRCPPTFISPETTPYRLQYTEFSPALDQLLCRLVTVFQTALDSKESKTCLSYLFTAGLPLLLFQSVESARRGRSILVAYPVLYNILAQVISVAMMLPMYWVLFLFSGSAKPQPSSVHVTRAQAEAILFGVPIGAIVSAGLVLLNDPRVTAIWQIYPVYIWLAYHVHHIFRSSSSFPESGYKIIRAAFIATFIFCSSTHISIVWPMMADLDTLKLTFFPLISPLPGNTEFHLLVLQFLKWDFVFTFTSTILASLWFAHNFKQVIIISLWYIFALPVVGPGAAIAAVALWRESKLSQHYDREKERRE